MSTETAAAGTRRSQALQTFYSDIVTTAIEGGINYWAEVHQYAWFSNTLSGGTAAPGPDGGDNAEAVIAAMDDDDEQRHQVTPDTIARAYTILAAGEVKYLGEETRKRYLKARREVEAGDIDASDADNIVQLGIFGELVYG